MITTLFEKNRALIIFIAHLFESSSSIRQCFRDVKVSTVMKFICRLL